MSKCGVDGCTRKHYARGVCGLHYQRWRQTGTLEAGPKAHGSLDERFLIKIAFAGEDECWEWTGGKSGKGYGLIQEGGKGSKNLLAHRVSFTIYKGPIPDGLNVLHSCDNPSCVNPKHLRAGTQSENIIEAIAKGRKFIPSPGKGEANPRSKLTLEQAKFIKANPQMMHTELAHMFGLSPNCIRGVRIGRTWKEA